MRILVLICALFGALLSVASAYAGEITCATGRLFVLSGPEVRIDNAIFDDTEDALRFVSGFKRGAEIAPPQDWSIPLWQEWKKRKAGTSDKDIRRFSDKGSVTYRIFYINPANVPDWIWHVSNDDICLGSVSVVKRTNSVEFTIPVSSGGTHPLIPRGMLRNKQDAVLVCLTTSFPILDYDLPKGPMAGWKNTICGMPGTVAGTTHMSQAAREGQRWVMWSMLATK